MHVFWIGLAALIIIVTLYQCSTREKYDITITYAGNMEFSDENANAFADAVSEVVDDINGDGKENVFFQRIKFSDTSTSADMDYASQSKLDAELQSGDTFIYLVSKDQANTWLNRNTGDVDIFAPADEWADISDVPSDRFLSRNGRAYAVKVTDSAVIKNSNIVHPDLYIMMRPLYDVYADNEKKSAQFEQSKKAAQLIIQEN